MLTICLLEFEQITIEECINYPLQTGLEQKVKNIVNTYFKTKKPCSEVFKDKELYDFLEYVLLRIGNSTEWISVSQNDHFQQKYLYTIIKKNVLLNISNNAKGI